MRRADAREGIAHRGRKQPPSQCQRLSAGSCRYFVGDDYTRLVSGTYKQFKQDLETLGLARQRQYESRSTFRNLALSAGAAEFHVNLITHPKPKRASDYHTRLELQWPGLCEAVLAIDPAAWVVANTGASSDEVTAEVTVEGSANEKPPTTLSIVGGELEREKGFELILRRRTNRATGHANHVEPL